MIERHGAEVSATDQRSDADFERYVSHHRHATLRWAREHPEPSPTTPTCSTKSREDWSYYLQDHPALPGLDDLRRAPQRLS